MHGKDYPINIYGGQPLSIKDNRVEMMYDDDYSEPRYNIYNRKGLWDQIHPIDFDDNGPIPTNFITNDEYDLKKGITNSEYITNTRPNNKNKRVSQSIKRSYKGVPYRLKRAIGDEGLEVTQEMQDGKIGKYRKGKGWAKD